MSKRKKLRPTAPLVINLIALCVVLGGHASALTGHGRVTRGDIAPGAVTARNFAPRVVSSAKLAAHAVTARKLDDSAVHGRAISPHSMRGANLALIGNVPNQIPDPDPAFDPNNWNSSPGVTANCPEGGLLLSGGVSIQDASSNHRAFLQSSAPTASGKGWLAAISTDTGGAASAQVFADCLP